jgi:hypothetical protein
MSVIFVRGGHYIGSPPDPGVNNPSFSIVPTFQETFCPILSVSWFRVLATILPSVLILFQLTSITPRDSTLVCKLACSVLVSVRTGQSL